jgi:hypothetical protein
MSLNTSGVPPSPCSIVATPAIVARLIPSAVDACAATFLPELFATFTAAVNSSSVGPGIASPFGPQR